MTTITFTIPGNPIPKARARTGGDHFYTPQRTRDFEEFVGWCALEAMRGEDRIEDHGIAATFRFYFESMVALKRADLTNSTKSIEDGMNLIVYRDDKQIWEEHTYKGLDTDRPRVDVRVELPDQPRTRPTGL